MLISIPYLGKTTCLFYLLLYRLEKRLPTAVQLDAEYYFICGEYGAVVHPLPFRDDRLKKCWTLADSNDKVFQVCPSFKSRAMRIIQISSPKPERWQGWRMDKQAEGVCIISDLPSVPEIAAIV